MKKCTKCKQLKPFTEFYKDLRAKSKVMSACKLCTTNYDKKYNQNNKDKIQLKNKLFRELNRDYNKTYRKNNKDKIKSYIKKKLITDIQYRLRKILRTRLSHALKDNLKTGSAVRDLGCTVQELKEYLEKQFELGMSWDNYGNKKGQWSIDHIKPLSSFDLTDRVQLLEAVNFKNLQPMWHIDNIRKGKALKN